MTLHVFQLSEFIVESELAFQFAHTPAAAPHAAARADLRIRLGTTPETLASPSCVTEHWQLETDQRFLLTAPGVGRFLLDRDGTVRVEPFGRADDVALRLCLLGSVFSAWLAMQGYVPLHAGAVEVAGGAALLCGRSGAGKSTTMALLARAGCPVLAEDLAILDTTGTVELLAFSGQVKLASGAIEALGLDPADCKMIAGPRAKYALSTPRTTGRRAVSKVLVLHPPGAPRPASGPARGAFAVRTLLNHVYRPRLVGHVLGEADLKARVARLADQLDVLHVERSDDYTLCADMRAHLGVAETLGPSP